MPDCWPNCTFLKHSHAKHLKQSRNHWHQNHLCLFEQCDHYICWFSSLFCSLLKAVCIFPMGWCAQELQNGSYYNTPLSTFGLCFKLKKGPVLEDPVFEGGEEVLGRDINWTVSRNSGKAEDNIKTLWSSVTQQSFCIIIS